MIKDVIIHDKDWGTSTEDPVVTAARPAFGVRLKDSSDVSENTKNAQAIAKAWRGAVHWLDLVRRTSLAFAGQRKTASAMANLLYRTGR
jgi:hypothetical protein